MPRSTNTIDYNYQTTAGTTVDATKQPTDNCHTIIIVNLTAAPCLYAIVATGTALTTANSATLPANSSVTLKIGTVEYRTGGIIGTGAGEQKVRINDAGAAVTLSMQYLNSTQEVRPG